MELQHQKHLFDIPYDITYLNIAAQSPSFKTMHNAGLEGLMQKKRPYLITTSDYFEPVKELKSLFAKLIEVDDYNRIALIPSVSYGIATVANNITLKSTDEILVIEEQFPSNYYSWKKLADKYNATLKIVKAPTSSKNKSEQLNAAIIEAINNNTALIAMGNIHWSNGTLFNLKAIRQKTKQHDALLIIDGSQSIGALPFSVKEIKPDAVICAGYKWLFGPYGCAYAYFGDYFDNGNPIEENWKNRYNSENMSGLTAYQDNYKPLANRYNAGESSSFIHVKMQIEGLKQVLKWTPKAIQDYCKTITTEAVKDLEALGFQIEHPNHRTHHLFGIKLPEGVNTKTIKEALAKQHVYVSFRGNFIRLSCHVFNTATDFKTLTNCLSKLIQNT
ncbi:aminotransferase class V-fold PLP-dependent enzyme [Olleya sp. R77988]|uniref:aminotransferase class V-fold PLP-dependent enzyme n=1 Tax=Olleya sp. R77988 TaxID=3093875 RepID=UPI0037C548D3